MSVCLLIVDDGREDYLERAVATAKANLPVERMAVVVVRDPDHTLGFAGAVAEGWERALATGREHIFHLESDFVFSEPVPLGKMVALLRRQPDLVQVALKRQAVNEIERDAGGIVEANPAAFEERRDDHATWTATRAFFTTNPSVYPRWVAERGWPQCAESEGRFGRALFATDPRLCSAFWGGKYDPPRVEHIGEVRTGTGY